LEDLIGIDTNLLSYALDPTFAEHAGAKKAILSSGEWAVNATVIHECFHTLVFRRKIAPTDTKLKIVEFLKDTRTSFLNLTKSSSLLALDLATKMNLGGRDSLILACYLQHHVPQIYSHDQDLIKLGKVAVKGKRTRIIDPLE
jgi:predicted nucleic acid-binding protein